MTTSSELQVVLKAVDRYSKEMKAAQNSFSSLAKQAAAFGVGVVGVNLGVQAFTRGIKAMSIDLVNAASDAEELRNKFDVTFGQSAAAAREELERFGDQVGRGTLELQRMAADTGAVVKSAGLMESQAASLSVNIAKLATDVASFTNANDADVLHAFTRALTGEREALKTYGVSINQAEVDAKALEMGIKAIGTQMVAADKAMVTYQLLLDKTKDSQGDAARTSGSYANQTRALKGEIEDLKGNLGELLLPTGTEVVSWLTTVTREATNAANAFKDFLDPTREIKRELPDLHDRLASLQAEEARIREEQDRLSGSLGNLATALVDAKGNFVGMIIDSELLDKQLASVTKEIRQVTQEIGTMEAGFEDAKPTVEAHTTAVNESVLAHNELMLAIQGAAREIGVWQDPALAYLQTMQQQKQELMALAAVTIHGQEVLKLYQKGQIDAAEAIEILNFALREQARNFGQVAEEAKKAKDAVKAIDETVKGQRADELGQRGRINADIENARRAIVHIRNQIGGQRGTFGDSPEARERGEARIRELEAMIRELRAQMPSFQTLPGQMRMIPGPMNAAMPIIAHGGEVIGRPGGNVINVYGDIYGWDDFVRKVGRAVLRGRGLGMDV